MPAFSLDQLVRTRLPGQFALSPDRTRVVFTRVGRYFGHALFTDYGDDNNLTVLDLRSGASLQVTSGRSIKTYPQFSPDGKRIAFESENDIWSVDVETGLSERLTTNVAADSRAAWSPDGREIAFTSARGGRPNLFVMDARGERFGLRQLTTEGAQTPTWTPDGRAIVYLASLDAHFYSRGIYSVPATGGPATRLTPADDARNSSPVFSPDGRRIAYVSNRSGFANLWTMAPDGADQVQATRQNRDQDFSGELIQSITPRWSPDGTRLLHFSNRTGNLDLEVTDLSARTTQVVDGRDGSELPVGWLDDRTVAYVSEDYRTPPDLYVRRLGEPVAIQRTFSSHATYRPEHFERLESVSWTSEDGVRVHGFLRIPSGTRPGERFPALVVSHTFNFGQFYNHWSAPFSYLAQSGYILLTVDHRGSSGYGVAFRDLPRGNWGLAQLQDVVSAARFLRSRPEVDADRVGMLGYSMGGYLTLLAATTHPTLFRAAVSVFGPTQVTGPAVREAQWHFGFTFDERPDRYRAVSPVDRAEQLSIPTLFLHGTGDPIVPVSQVYDLVGQLGRERLYELAVYPSDGHGIVNLDDQVDSCERVVRFLDTYLRR